MSEKNRQYAYVKFIGNFQPDDISAALGIEASETKIAGGMIGRSNRIRKESQWKLDSGLSDEEELEDHITKLLQLLGPARTAFAELARHHKAVLQLVGYFGDEGYPGLHLEVETVKAIAEFNLNIDFDFYRI
jgi:Domain of unknown function (DUF4279)